VLYSQPLLPPLHAKTTMHIRSASNTNEVNWDDPLNKGLVAWYPFKERGGNVLHDIANRHDGDLYKVEQNDWVPCTETGAMALDLDGADSGIDEYVVGPSIESINGTKQLTVTAWIRPRQANAGNVGIVAKYVTTDSTRSWALSATTTATLEVALSSNGAFQSANSVSTGLTYDDQWRHVAFTYDANWGTKVFTHGLLRNTNTTRPSSLYQSSKPVIIGMAAYDAFDALADRSTFNGGISDVRIYSRALSESEVHDLYVASRTGYVDQFKRRYFPVSLPTEEPPTETATSGLIRLKSPRQSEPSYKAGYAKSASESANPELWDGLKSAWVPSLGNTGLRVRDVVGSNDGDSHSSTIWEENGLRYVLNSGDRGTTCGPDSRLINLPEISIALRFKANAASDGRQLSIFSKITDQNECAFDFRRMSDNSSLFVVERATVRNRTPTPSGTFAAGEWYDVVCTFDRGTTHCIVNGELIATESGGPILNTSFDADVCIGDNKRPNIYTFDGVVQTAMVWDRALTQDDARNLHADPLAPFRQRRYAPFSLTTEEPPTTFNHWYALPGRINRIVGSGVNF